VSERYKRNPNTACFGCSKPIYRRPIEIKAGRVFCGLDCYGISNRKESPCAACGKPILASLNKKTCSRSCSNKYREGIKYKIGRPHDKAQAAHLLKLRLLESRGKKCERCGYDKVEILQIHHKDRDRDHNDLNNLELICPNCHYEEHYSKNKDSWIEAQLNWKSRFI
jgi:hypothetical protein